ncbi:MAG TPA: nuclear transport factor 2 family protein [Baekduia sp.]|nr:nuclear transport factor 2 family protein [Baekduia sp.]
MAEMQITARPLDAETAMDFTGRWLAGWNAHDPDGILALLHGDVIVEASSWPTTMHGHGAVREYLEATLAAFPDIQFEQLGEPLMAPHEPHIAWCWRGTATHRGRLEPFGLDATRTHAEFEGGIFCTIREGKADRIAIYFDTAEPMRQMGVLPIRGSRGERSMMAMSNLRSRMRRRRG